MVLRCQIKIIYLQQYPFKSGKRKEKLVFFKKNCAHCEYTVKKPVKVNFFLNLNDEKC